MSETIYEEEEFETEWNGRTLLRTARFGLRHWKLMIGFLGAVLLTALIESYMTFLTKQIIDDAILAGDNRLLQRLIAQYALWWLLFSVCIFLFIYLAGNLSHRVQYDLRRDMFAKLQELQLAYYDRTPTGWLQARVTSDVVRVGELVSWGFLDATWAVGAIATALAFMYYLNWRLALVVTLVIPILVVVAFQFKKHILQEFRTVRRVNSKITNSFSQSISGVRVVKALGREEANAAAFGGLVDEMYVASYRAAWLSALFLPIVQLISATAVAAIVLFGGWQVIGGTMSIGEIQAFIGYVTLMLWPVYELSRVYASMQQAIASAERIFALIDTEATVVDRPGASELPSMRGDIRFDNVSFAYEDGQPVLQNFSLCVDEGEIVAIVGPTGAGKTTIVNLLARFYEPTAGRIYIAGHDYQNLTLHALQSRIGMVPQTPYLFGGAILENIRYGRLDATDEEVIAAAKMAGVDTFVDHLDGGFAAQVGEDGVLLSQGQRQLISIARAILANPDILIMDEATSSVDTLTEALIQQAMERLMRGRTTFVIAHRLSTIKHADRILLIEKGRIAEMGSHRELIRRRGGYYNLYTRQFRQEREALLRRNDPQIALALSITDA